MATKKQILESDELLQQKKEKLTIFQMKDSWTKRCLNINSITYQTPWKITRIYP